MPKWPTLTTEICQLSVQQFLKIRHFWPTWTICTSNESWEHSEFKFDIKNTIYYEKNCIKRVFQNFRLIFYGIFFFETQNFWKFLYTTPKIFIIHLFLRPKMEITWRFDTPNFIPDKTASLQSRRGQIPPPLRVKGMPARTKGTVEYWILSKKIFHVLKFQNFQMSQFFTNFCQNSSQCDKIYLESL